MKQVITVTEFARSDRDDQWYWRTVAANNEPVGDGAEGYGELRKAVHGFFVQQGSGEDDPRYGELTKVNDRLYRIEKYAA